MSCAVDYDFYFICVDFNTNFLNRDSFSDALCDVVCSVGLQIVKERLPTRFSPSLLFLVSDFGLCFLYDQISFVSDHYLIFCTKGINLNKVETSIFINYRNYNSIDYSALYSELSSIGWTSFWHQPSVDSKLKTLGIHSRGRANPTFDPDEFNNFFVFVFSTVSESDVINAVATIR